MVFGGAKVVGSMFRIVPIEITVNRRNCVQLTQLKYLESEHVEHHSEIKGMLSGFQLVCDLGGYGAIPSETRIPRRLSQRPQSKSFNDP